MAKQPIQVARVPTKRKRRSLDLLAELCYLYPQYQLSVARRLPYRRVNLLIRVARKQKALEHHTLTQIAFAPHTKKAKAVEMLLKHFKDVANG